MLVTNRDCVLADYAVRSYAKVWPIYDSFVLEVYANCLSRENRERYFPQWKQCPYVSIRENQKERDINRVKGAHFASPEGIPLRYEQSCEISSEVWTREHQLAKTPFWATVDADFEVLQPQFLLRMMEMLRSDSSLAGVSTDYSPTNDNHFDTYSKEVIRLNGRWHTWCCIYRKEIGQFLSEVSSFYFELRLPNGKRDAFDCYANFQKHLIGKCYQFAVLPSEFQNQFIHYGAFSKNKSVTRKNVALYRQLAIWSKCGWVPRELSCNLNDFSANLSRRVLDGIFAKAIAERQVYDYEYES